MKSSADYQVRFLVESPPSDGSAGAVVKEVKYCQCSCLAGKGPLATCKHVAAILFALEHFCRLGFTKDTVTCTERLQEWNKPCSKISARMCVSDMDVRKSSLGKQIMITTKYSKHRSRPEHTAADLSDPRPSSKRGQAQERMEQLLEKSIAEGKMPCPCCREQCCRESSATATA